MAGIFLQNVNSDASHFAVELPLFASAGPAAVFLTLVRMKQWEDELLLFLVTIKERK